MSAEITLDKLGDRMSAADRETFTTGQPCALRIVNATVTESIVRHCLRWAALTRFEPMINRWISLVPSYSRSKRTSR
jgi:hypothetical protein